MGGRRGAVKGKGCGEGCDSVPKCRPKVAMLVLLPYGEGVEPRCGVACPVPLCAAHAFVRVRVGAQFRASHAPPRVCVRTCARCARRAPAQNRAGATRVPPSLRARRAGEGQAHPISELTTLSRVPRWYIDYVEASYVPSKRLLSAPIDSEALTLVCCATPYRFGGGVAHVLKVFYLPCSTTLPPCAAPLRAAQQWDAVRVCSTVAPPCYTGCSARHLVRSSAAPEPIRHWTPGLDGCTI